MKKIVFSVFVLASVLLTGPVKAAGPSYPVFPIQLETDILIPGKAIVPAGKYVVRIIETQSRSWFKKEEGCQFEFIRMQQDLPYYFDERTWEDNTHMVTTAPAKCMLFDLQIDRRDYFDAIIQYNDTTAVIYYQSAYFPSDEKKPLLFTATLPVRYGDKAMKEVSSE